MKFDHYVALVKRYRWLTQLQLLLSALVLWLAFDSVPQVRALSSELVQRLKEDGISRQSAAGFMESFIPHAFIGSWRSDLEIAFLFDVHASLTDPTYFERLVEPVQPCSPEATESIRQVFTVYKMHVSKLLSSWSFENPNATENDVMKRLVETKTWSCLKEHLVTNSIAQLVEEDWSQLEPYYEYYGQRIVVDSETEFVTISEEYLDTVRSLDKEAIRVVAEYQSLRETLWSHALSLIFDGHTEGLLLRDALVVLDVYVDGRFGSPYAFHLGSAYDAELVDDLDALITLFQDRELPRTISVGRAEELTQSLIPIRMLQLEIPRNPAKVVIPFLLLAVSLNVLLLMQTISRAFVRVTEDVFHLDWQVISPGYIWRWVVIFTFLAPIVCIAVFLLRQFGSLPTWMWLVTGLLCVSSTIVQIAALRECLRIRRFAMAELRDRSKSIEPESTEKNGDWREEISCDGVRLPLLDKRVCERAGVYGSGNLERGARQDHREWQGVPSLGGDDQGRSAPGV